MKCSKFYFMKICLFFFFALGISSAYAQEGSVTGQIVDAADKSPLPGVSVIQKGTTAGVITDMDGRFTLKVNAKTTLVLSFIGYDAKEVVVNPGDKPTFELSVKATNLEEVVIIGYGAVKKSDATGSVTAVSSKDFNKGAITSPQDLLVGKSSGVVITSSGGAPGGKSTISVRGGASMSASNDPLIVIDGVPVDNNEIKGMANPLSTINPNDIETFTVLKDASATAIYGSRASNGVIVITTKKGGKGFRVSYNGSTSISSRTGKVDVFSAEEYKTLVKDHFGANSEAASKLSNSSTDWQDEIFRTAIGQDHNISVSGTYKALPYRASIGYTNQDGILKTSNLERETAAIGLDPTFLDNHLKLNINVKGVMTKNRFAETGAIGSAVYYDPTRPIYDSNGNYSTWRNKDGNLDYLSPSNPVAMLNQTNDRSTVKRSIGNIQADYKFHFLPDLRANLNLAYDYSQSDGNKDVEKGTSWTQNTGDGLRSNYTQTKRMQLVEFYLNYTKKLDAIASKIDLMGGYSWQKFYGQDTYYSTDYDATKVIANTINRGQNFLVSFYGRLNYTLKDRYLLTFTLRDDGSSKFAKGNQWGLFPSSAFAWKIKDESFMSSQNLFSDLKLRVGYGQTGQQDIGANYGYRGFYKISSLDNTAQYQFGNTFYNTLRSEGYYKDIKWETTTTYNSGLDFGFLKDKITGSVDVYYRKTTDMLNTVPLPAGSNLTNQLTINVGDMENKGIEFSLNYKPIATKNFTWDIGYNFSYNKNTITKLSLSDDPSFQGVLTGGISGGKGNTIQINSVDYSRNAFYVYKQIYNTDGTPAEGLYKDLKADGTINSSDYYRFQKSSPDVVMGISTRLTYKDFDFSCSGRASINNYVYNNLAASTCYTNIYPSTYLSNIPKYINDTKFVSPQFFSDYFVENASFFKMDNISIGYNLSKLLKNKFNAYISASVQNVFTITKYKGMDPEVDGGIDNNLYPRPRVFTLGVKLDL